MGKRETGGDGQDPALGHRIARIDAEVEKSLVHLGPVGIDAGEIDGKIKNDVHRPRESLFEHLPEFRCDLVDVDRFERRISFARECEDLAHQGGAALRRFLNCGGAAGKFGRIAGHLGQERGVAHDDAEDVVEVVRNPAGKRADGLEFLRLEKLLL